MLVFLQKVFPDFIASEFSLLVFLSLNVRGVHFPGIEGNSLDHSIRESAPALNTLDPGFDIVDRPMVIDCPSLLDIFNSPEGRKKIPDQQPPA